MTDRLSGRVAMVTGAGTGLGRRISLQLAEAGVAVGVLYATSSSAADEVRRAIAARGGRAVAVHCDVAGSASVDDAVRTVEDQLGPIDFLVNNAGTTQAVPMADLEGVTDEAWHRLLDVNLVGAFRCVRAVATSMRRRGTGAIVNVASNSARTGSGSSLPYVVSKAGLVALTVSLAKALAPQIRVNAVSPGWMLTEWVDRHLSNELGDRIRSGVLPVTDVDDVAAAAIALLANPSITGEVLVVDRGESLGL